MATRTETRIAAYVAAVLELRRLEALAPTEEFATERARTIKEAKAKVESWYRTLSGGALGKARRILAETETAR